MPRSLTRPQTGMTLWYFAAAPPVNPPLMAEVIAQVTSAGSGVGSPPPTFDLLVTAADGTTSKAAAVPFHYGTRPTTGAWCTMPRVNTPAAGVWPSLSDGPMEYLLHDLDKEKREAKIEELKAAAQEAAKEAAKAEKAEKAASEDEDDDDNGDEDEPRGRTTATTVRRTTTTSSASGGRHHR